MLFYESFQMTMQTLCVIPTPRQVLTDGLSPTHLVRTSLHIAKQHRSGFRFMLRSWSGCGA